MTEASECRSCGTGIDGRQASLGLCSRCETKALAAGEICQSCKRPLDSYPCDFCGKSAPDPGWNPLSVSFVAVIAVALVWIGYVVVTGMVGLFDADPSGRRHSTGGAFVACKNAAEDRLRAPQTAEWPSLTRSDVQHEGSGRYRVETYVDAQNAFGAMLRSDVECAVQYDDSDGSWIIRSVSIDTR